MTTIEILGKYLTERGWVKNNSNKQIKYYHTHGKDVKAAISLFQDRLKIVIYEYYINITQHKKQITRIWLYSDPQLFDAINEIQ